LFAKKAKKTRTNKSNRGSAVNPHESDGEDDSCWQVLMLELKRSQVILEQEKWDDQKQHQPIRIELENENLALYVRLKKNMKQQQEQQKDLD
jgi:hypothetical protein